MKYIESILLSPPPDRRRRDRPRGRDLLPLDAEHNGVLDALERRLDLKLVGGA